MVQLGKFCGLTLNIRVRNAANKASDVRMAAPIAMLGVAVAQSIMSQQIQICRRISLNYIGVIARYDRVRIGDDLGFNASIMVSAVPVPVAVLPFAIRHSPWGLACLVGARLKGRSHEEFLITDVTAGCS